MYLSPEDYIKYGGQLDINQFERLRFRAEKEIDKHTQSRLRNARYGDIAEEVKRCMLELIDYINNNLSGGDIRVVQSESNDGVSASYETKTADSAMYNIIYTYLSGTGLMYRGVS